MNKKLLLINCLLTIHCVLLLSTCKQPSSERSIDDIVPLTKTWEMAIPHQEIPSGLMSISAEACGACHQEIYKEWQQSTHAVAFQDLQFQAEWKKDNIYACLNCHTPLQNQQEFIVNGLINGDYKTPSKEINPHFDQKLQQEGITCATCHVRNRNIIGMTEIKNAAHKTIQNAEFLSEKLCIGCHNLVDELNQILVCTFETGDEWQNDWAHKEGKTCISCHMPETERPLFPGMQIRKSHLHSVPGSGIPKFFEVPVQLLKSLEIEVRGVRDSYELGDTINVFLRIRNEFSGHSIPTGDPERFFLIKFRLEDGDNHIVKKEEHRIGEQWQWHPVAKKLSDNNLKPLEERVYTFDYDIKKQGTLLFIVEITKHRMTEENAKQNGILGKYPLSIEVFKKPYNIRVE